ncbi:WASH complex subunit 3-like [Dendronephthya gigantea]|uniref:WASH complex subunit 3-like n=1 Tax=Dendronephthya gigantea TaxID=151771 RepID=UPI00106CAADE|nr:WASH complex subunit 3-like [Dendronephthya gigantea]
MDSDGLPIMGPAIDLTKVGSIQQKRTIAFLNHFISHTVNFLNRFSCVCEEKLSDLSNRLQRVDVTMSILEAKLASIPGLENVTVSESPSAGPTASETPATTTPSTNGEEANVATNNEEAPPPIEEEPAQPVMTVAKDPRYAKYFQMLKVGVPLAALRPKVIADGLDPDLLETPDAPAPGGGQVSKDSDDDDDEISSASSFSDDDD